MKTVPTKVPLTFEKVESVFKLGKKKRATPHREPDFKKIRKLGVKDDEPVRGTLWFIEEHGVGPPSIPFLERWEFITQTPEGKQVRFWADLLPGYIRTEELPSTEPVIPSP